MVFLREKFVLVEFVDPVVDVVVEDEVDEILLLSVECHCKADKYWNATGVIVIGSLEQAVRQLISAAVEHS